MSKQNKNLEWFIQEIKLSHRSWKKTFNQVSKLSQSEYAEGQRDANKHVLSLMEQTDWESE